YLASWSRLGRLAPALVGISVVALGLTNPFSLVSLCAVFPGHLAVTWLQDRRLPRAAPLGVGAALLAAAPFLVYYLFVFGRDPFWGVVYGQQNIIPSAPLPLFALGLAPTLALAVAGFSAFVGKRTPACQLVLVYIFLGLALM